MILVVERDPALRSEILQTVRWIDGRHRVAECADAYTAIKQATRLKPDVVLAGPSVSADFANVLRTHVPGAYIVGVGTKVIDDKVNAFHATLPVPVDHAKVREIIAARRARKTENRRAPSVRKAENSISVYVAGEICASVSPLPKARRSAVSSSDSRGVRSFHIPCTGTERN